MRRFTLRQRLRYRFDMLMARGTIAVIVWLFVVSTAGVLAISALVYALDLAPPRDGRAPSFGEIVWMSMMRTLDAGTMGNDVGGWPFLLAMLAVTTGGVFFVGTLIGLLSSAVSRRVDELRKGRSLVVEKDHIVVLGWSPQLVPLLAELVYADTKAPVGCVAILAQLDKARMEDEIRALIPSTGRVRVVCRTGLPSDTHDLSIMNPAASRSIVILSEPGPASDARVLKTILALVNQPRRRFQIIAAVRDPQVLPIGEFFGRERVALVTADDIIARVIVQASRQAGLSMVYAELLTFRGGNDVFFADVPALTGVPFARVVLAFAESSPIGIRRGSGEILLNPEGTVAPAPGDRLIVLAQAPDRVVPAAVAPPVDLDALREPSAPPAAPERTLLIGWNVRGPRVLTELDDYVAAGSHVRVVARGAIDEAALPALDNLTVTVSRADLTRRAEVEALDVPSFAHVIVLSDEGCDGGENADAATLVALLHLRDIARASGASFSLVTEMLDERNRHLAQVAKADDYVVSDQLVSMVLAQMAQNPEIKPVFDELLDAEGSEVHIRPAADYVALDRPVTYATVVEAAVRRRECAIGYRLDALKNDAARNHGVTLNPRRGDRVLFGARDSVVVVALH